MIKVIKTKCPYCKEQLIFLGGSSMAVCTTKHKSCNINYRILMYKGLSEEFWVDDFYIKNLQGSCYIISNANKVNRDELHIKDFTFEEEYLDLIKTLI